MHFLLIDSRFGTPIYVFLEADPRGTETDPGLTVREVTIEFAPDSGRSGGKFVLGRDPHHLGRFREFHSDRAAAQAGFILIEPRYVGPTWEGYSREFRPQGGQTHKRVQRGKTVKTGE